MKKIIRLIVIAVVCGILIAGIVISDIFNVPALPTILAAFLGAVILYLRLAWLDVTSGWKFSFVRLKTNAVLHDTDYVRISFAYTFRIIVDGHYLLVVDKYNKYQSPGGCYKATEDEKYYLRKKFNACADQSTPLSLTDTTKNDYRMRIPVPKLRGFVRRFQRLGRKTSTNRRETYKDASREFKEELIDTGILDSNIFKSVKYFYQGQYQAPIIRSPYFNAYELMLTDILEVQLTPNQEDYLRKILSNNQDNLIRDYRFVTTEQISHCGLDREKHTQAFIMENVYKITDESLKDLKNRPRKLETYTMEF